MNNLKTKKEISIIREGGAKLARIIQTLKKEATVGMQTIELDGLAEELTLKEGGIPSFKDYKGFPNALCVSINDVVVHGVPSSRKIQKNDIISLDFGFFYKGFHTDMAITFFMGEPNNQVKKLINVTRKSLEKGIEASKAENKLGDIGSAVESYVKKNGFMVVEGLCGHAIGKEVHEDPQILNTGVPNTGIEIKEGFVFCIEPMVTIENPHIMATNEGFRTKNISAHFEHTIAIVDGLPVVMTDI